MARVVALLTCAGSLALFAAATNADLFDLPSSGGGATVTAPPPTSAGGSATPARQRAAEATLLDHAVYYAFCDLGLNPDARTKIWTRLAQYPAVHDLPPDKAFLVGMRVADRIDSELGKARETAASAARSVLRDAAGYRTALPLGPGSPDGAAPRLEQAIAAARGAIISQGVRLQYTKWLDEAVQELAKSPS